MVNRRRLTVIAALAVGIVAIVALALIFLIPKGPERITANLFTQLNETIGPHTTIYDAILRGSVHNVGDRAGYAVIHFTISDNRGYSTSGTVDLGKIPAGDHVDVFESYEWPSLYNGMGAKGVRLSLSYQIVSSA